MRDKTYKNGFSLVEVLIAILLVGLAIASLVTANSALTKANGAGADLSTAEFLIEQMRELTAMLAVIDPQTGKRETHGHNWRKLTDCSLGAPGDQLFGPKLKPDTAVKRQHRYADNASQQRERI